MNESALDALVKEAFEGVVVDDRLVDATCAKVASASAGADCNKVDSPREGTKTKRPAVWPHVVRVLAFAACLAVVAIGVFMGHNRLAVKSYVDVEAGALYTLALNGQGTVVEVTAAGSSQDSGASRSELEGEPLELALATLLEDIDAQDAYASEEQEPLFITVSAEDEEEAAQIEGIVRDVLDTSSHKCCLSSLSAQQRDAAREAGMGMGRYRVYVQLVEAGCDITVDDARAMTMRELRDLAKEKGVEIEVSCQNGRHMGEGAGRGRGRAG